MPNNALEQTTRHRGPGLAAARSSWSAAQLGRWADKRAGRVLRYQGER